VTAFFVKKWFCNTKLKKISNKIYSKLAAQARKNIKYGLPEINS